MKIKGIPVINAIKKSHHNQDFKSIKRQSMKVQSIHVMSALKQQDEKSNIILPIKDCFDETILPKGWKLNEASEKPTGEEMVLLMLKRTTRKLTCALKVTFCGESRVDSCT